MKQTSKAMRSNAAYTMFSVGRETKNLKLSRTVYENPTQSRTLCEAFSCSQGKEAYHTYLARLSVQRDH